MFTVSKQYVHVYENTNNTRLNYLFLFFIYLGITVTTTLFKEVKLIVLYSNFHVVHEGKGQSPDPAIFFSRKDNTN